MRLSTVKFLSTTSNLRACTPLAAGKQTVLFQPRNMSTGIPSETAQEQSQSQQTMGSTRLLPTSAELGIENRDIKCAPGVTLNDQQKVIVGSILDLFAGRPSLKKLQLWTDDATFADPITQAQGRKQYEPQWYGLQKTFTSISRLNQSVTSSGSPITMDLSTKYTLSALGAGTKDLVVDSVVRIHTDPHSGKITQVEDRWKNQLPEGAFAKASWTQMLSLRWWVSFVLACSWWGWGLVWWTWPWLAFRKLNAVTVPVLVSVPKNEEEDQKKGN